MTTCEQGQEVIWKLVGEWNVLDLRRGPPRLNIPTNDVYLIPWSATDVTILKHKTYVADEETHGDSNLIEWLVTSNDSTSY